MHIVYETKIEAKTAMEAETKIFELMADDITAGVIRTDLFDNGKGAGMRFPLLESVEVAEND